MVSLPLRSTNYPPSPIARQGEKCNQRTHIFKTVGLQTFDEIFHTPGFAEHSRGIPLLQKVKRDLVVHVNLTYITTTAVFLSPH